MYRVLIAEDEEIIRKGLVYMVDWTELDCVVAGQAEDGEEGLRMIEKLKPDLVLTDVCMPKKNGLEMVREGQKICSFCTIFLSGYSEFGYVREALKLQAADYLLKPVDVDMLRDVVRTGIEKLKEIRKAEAYLESSSKEAGGAEWSQILYTPDIQNYYVKQIVERVKLHYQEKLSLSEFAEEFHFSERYLSSKFKEETTYSFLDFLNRYRIVKAIELIRQGRWRISEISEMVGFTQYKQFHGVFIKYMGIPPTKFMEKYSLRSSERVSQPSASENMPQ